MHNPRLARSLRSIVCSLALLAWGSSAAAAQQSRHTLGLPGTGWSVALDLPGFQVTDEDTRADGEGRMMQAVHAESGMMVSLFVEREPERQGTEACRDLYWKRMRESPVRKLNVRRTQQPPLSVMHYLIPDFEGQRVMHQNANAYYGRDGVCMDLHLSKAGYTAADSALFQAILRTVRIEDVDASAAEATVPAKVEQPEAQRARLSHAQLPFVRRDLP